MAIVRVAVGEFILKKAEEKALMEVIKSGRLSEDKKTFEFEKAWAQYIGTKFCVAVNSGTSALMAGLMALKNKFKIKDGAGVITSPLTFVATTNAIIHCGLRPIFVDIDRQTLVITAENIKKALKNETSVSIILPVHLMGYVADMDAINEVAREFKLLVIEDASQAHGSVYQGKRAGSLSDLAAFSFYIAHNIQAGELGAVTTNNPEIFKLLKKIKAHGRMCECNICTRSRGICPPLDNYKGEEDFDPRFYHDLIGFNFKTMEFQAALGLTQLKKADEIFKQRNFNVKYLNEGLRELDNFLELPYYSKDVSYLAYPLVIKDTRTISRFRLRRELEKAGIETGSPKIMKKIKKNLDLSVVKEKVLILKKYGILLSGFFMLGFPDETEEDIKETIKFMLELPLDRMQISIFSPYPGCEEFYKIFNFENLDEYAENVIN